MKALLSTCLVVAFFSPVASLICASCLNLFGPCVNTEMQDCKDDGDICISLHFEVSLFPFLKINFKSCGPGPTCQNGDYRSTTEQNIHFRAIMDCCDENMCNQDIKIKPSVPKLVSNKLLCPGCYYLGTNNCTSKAKIPCYGEQTQCMNAAGSVQINRTVLPLSMPFALQACTTPNICTFRVPLEFSSGGNIFKLSKMNCSPATFNSSKPTDGIVPGR
ncbi:ly6/PLAUR domain-containing protein 8 [Sphaerodactylus townsendi]|uniref:ly6/PLAUR domain-containing protein 8 n=1 Tax=Sphaerodactylus townsendi TaxID=933632 RepID=UPI0020262071|nr:ly6/PLAUR domain-containing protein 8 [Sphaerodactylus townsendi]